MENTIAVKPDIQAALLARVKDSYHAEAVRFLDRASREGLTLETMKSHVTSLEGLSVSTINKHIAAMRAVVRAAFTSPDLTDVQRWKLEQALKEIPLRKKASKAIDADKVLSPEEIEILLRATTPRLGGIIKFLAVTGCRVSEALSIKLDDCKINEGIVFIRLLGKGKKERFVKIGKQLFDQLRAVYAGSVYLFETQSGNPVHDRNFAKELRRIGIKALRRSVNPHMLRHSFATEKIRKTGKIKAVSEYLGHSTTAITMDLYNHEILSAEDLGIKENEV